MTRWAVLTGEYPPQSGGVSDYTRLVARGLSAAGDSVIIYAPPAPAPDPADVGVTIRRLPDHFGPRGLLVLDQDLSGRPRPDCILIQYVPHAFGLKGMNLPFAIWVATRAYRLAPVWVMFHEVVFPFRWRPATHALLGTITGLMARLIAGAATRVLVSIPGWGPLLRRLCPRVRAIEWFPVPCAVDTISHGAAVNRACYAPNPSDPVVGHFGTFGRLITELLTPTVQELLRTEPTVRLLFIGRGSDHYREHFAQSYPDLAGRLHATGELSSRAVSAHIRTCDLLLQPYRDGVSSRRTSMMAGLANGVPVVSNLGFLSEPLWASAAGVVVASRPDPGCLAAAVQDVLRRPLSVRAEMGKGAAELYRSNFSLDHTLARLRASGARGNS